MPYTKDEREERIRFISHMLKNDECSVSLIAQKLGTQEKNVRTFMKAHGLQTKGMRKHAERTKTR